MQFIDDDALALRQKALSCLQDNFSIKDIWSFIDELSSFERNKINDIMSHLQMLLRDLLPVSYTHLVIADSTKETPDAIIIATGSEVSLALDAKAELAKEDIDVRVVSMPCIDLFEQQSAEYKEAVLPKAIRARVAVEAGTDFGWGKYVGLDGAVVTMHGFGASAPAGILFKKFGFTTENVVNTVKSVL